jgi:hypothetical protein
MLYAGWKGFVLGWGGGEMFNRRDLNCTNLPDHSVRSIKRLSDEELHRYVGGWQQGSEFRIRGEVELRRRVGWVSRWALGASMLALVVSVAALFAKASI